MVYLSNQEKLLDRSFLTKITVILTVMRGWTATQAMPAYNMRPNEKWIFPCHETYLSCIPSAPCRKKVVEGTLPRTKVVEDVENGDGGGDDEEWALRRNSPTRR